MRTDLRERVKQGVAARLGRMTPEISDRVRTELDLISHVGCERLFCVAADLVDVVKRSGGVVGPGFGRVPASFVAYALGITDVNPLVHKGLVFELFLYARHPRPPRLMMNLDRIGFDAAFRYLKVLLPTADGLPRIVYDPALDTRLAQAAAQAELPSEDRVHAAVLELPGHERHREAFARNEPGAWEILRETHGAILYDEQVVTIAMSLAHLTIRKAVALWRAAKKCDQEALDRARPHFVYGCRDKLMEEDANRLYDQIVDEGRYTMSRAHYVAVENAPESAARREGAKRGEAGRKDLHKSRRSLFCVSQSDLRIRHP